MLRKTMLRLLPANRFGDRIYAFGAFLHTHRRLPRPRAGGLADRLYRLKTSQEILDPLRIFVTDKEWVKYYVKATVGDEFNVPTVAVLRSPDEATAFAYPARCVIKPTHLSGQVILRRDGEPIDFTRLRQWFRTNYYSAGREVNYRTLLPKVIVEPFAFDDANPSDFKIFCVDGTPRMIQVDQDRHTAHTRTYYTPSWDLLPFTAVYPLGAGAGRPSNLQKMLEVAAALSRHLAIVRVDLYSSGEQVRVGELTNIPENGRFRFVPATAEKTVADLLFGPGTTANPTRSRPGRDATGSP